MRLRTIVSVWTLAAAVAAPAPAMPRVAPSRAFAGKSQRDKAAASVAGRDANPRRGVSGRATGVSRSAEGLCLQPAANCQQRENTNALQSNRSRFVVAEDFRPAADGVITGICWWGTYARELPGGGFENCQGENPDRFEVRYYQDNGGIPGTLIAEFFQTDLTLLASPPQPTGAMIVGLPEFAFTASHGGVAVSAGQRYWIEISNLPASDCAWFWEVASEGTGEAVQDGDGTNPPDGFDVGDVITEDLALCLSIPIDIAPPPNDDCAAAEAINGQGTFPFDILNASADGTAPASCFPSFDTQIESDVWYCWTAPCTDTVFVRTCGLTAVDTMIAVYDGCAACPPTGAALRACNDDRCVDFPVVRISGQSMATFHAQAGQSYLIRIGRFPGTARGTGTFEITCGPPPDNACTGASGDCCAINATPGCNDETCCAAVCACDPQCCVDGWVVGCESTGFLGSGCGAQLLCQEVCPVCGDPSAGDCCAANGTPGCSDQSCCDAVCACDPSCCESGWDSFCVANNQDVPGCDAATLCGGLCPCGDPSAGDCCEANGTPGCDEASCCAAVCAQDPFCCDVAWDASCVRNNLRVPGADAETLCAGAPLFCGICGEATAGDCCTNTGTPGCASRDCCRAVCTVDSFCCEVFWDRSCSTAPFRENRGSRCLCPDLCTPVCPAVPIQFQNPTDGAVDARQPHAVNDVNQVEGVDAIVVSASDSVTSLDCWTLCETVVAGAGNDVASVQDHGDGTYTLHLNRPMTVGAVTTITYRDDCLIETTGRFTFHPANVSGLGPAEVADVGFLTDCLTGAASCDVWQCDIDRSGACTPADLLREIDLLGGGAAFDPWLNSPLPPNGSCP